MLEFSYTIGIKRRFLPFYQKYKVLGHKTEMLGQSGRLVMTMVDGSTLTIPEIGKRFLRVYPDYDNAIANQKKFKAGKMQSPPPMTEDEVSADGISEGI